MTTTGYQLYHPLLPADCQSTTQRPATICPVLQITTTKVLRRRLWHQSLVIRDRQNHMRRRKLLPLATITTTTM